MQRKTASEAEHRRVALRVHTALAMMIQGAATLEEWRDICDAINITEALCDIGKMAPELHAEQLATSTESMAEAFEDFRDLGRMRMSDRALDALKHVVGAYDLAIGRFSQETLASAHMHFAIKVASARAKPDPTVRVVE